LLTVIAAPVVAADRDEGRRLSFATFSSFGLFGIALIGKIRRKRILTAVGLLLVVGFVFGTLSCGGKTASSVNTSTQTPTSYVVTVNGDAGSVQLSTTVVVTVK
jgi:hypothetical protein